MKKLGLKKLVAGVLALLMIVTAIPADGLGGAFVAKADSAVKLVVRGDVCESTYSDGKANSSITFFANIPGAKFTAEDNGKYIYYRCQDYYYSIKKDNRVLYTSNFVGRYVEKDQKGGIWVNEEDNMYNYGDLGYSEYNVRVGWGFNLEDEFNGEKLSTLYGTYTVELYKASDDTKIASDSVVIDQLTITGYGDTQEIITYSLPDAYGYFFDYDDLLRKGYVIDGFTYNGTKIALGDDNDTAMLNKLNASTSVHTGTNYDLTATYTANTELNTLSNFAWDTSTGVFTATIDNKDTVIDVWLQKLNPQDGAWTTVWEEYTYVADVNRPFVCSYNDNTNVFTSGELQPYLLHDGTYRVGVKVAPETRLLRTAEWKVLTDGQDVNANENNRLDTPTDLCWASDVADRAVWDSVDGAAYYEVRIYSKNSRIWTRGFTTNNFYDFEWWIADVGEGDYQFQVKAVSGDLTVKGSSLYSDPSDILGFTEDQKQTQEAVENKVTDNIAAASEENADITPAVKEEINNAVSDLKTAYTSDDNKELLRQTIKDDSKTQENIRILSEAYKNANNIDTQDPHVDAELDMDAGKIKMTGAELSANSGSSIQLKVSNPTDAQKNLNGMQNYSSVVAFKMELTKTEAGAAQSESVHNLDIPVTIEIPVPANMDPLKLVILHYFMGDDENPEVIYPAFITRDGVIVAIFTITSFSTFAFAEEAQAEPDPGPVYPGGGGGGGGSVITPTPTPDPTEEPTTGTVQDPKEYTDENGEIIPSKVNVPEKDGSGTQLTKDANGNITVKDDVLGEAKNNSPAVFVPGKLYRLYNSNSGEHFYTKNPQERDALAKLGWNYEANESVTAIGAQDDGAKPVYRVYNPNSGLHHYTTDQKEALNLKKVGWSYEGISFYAYNKDNATGTDVYRVYCPFPDANGQNQHVYTSSKAEKDHLVSLGYKDEGVCWRTK